MNRHTFESRQSTFFEDIDTKLQRVEQKVALTVKSYSTTVGMIDATLAKVVEDTTKMGGLLETNQSQLQQLRDDKAARVAVMQDHSNRLDTMDTLLKRVTNKVMKTIHLVEELESKILASCPAPMEGHQRPVKQPITPGFVSPARPLAPDGTNSNRSGVYAVDEARTTGSVQHGARDPGPQFKKEADSAHGVCGPPPGHDFIPPEVPPKSNDDETVGAPPLNPPSTPHWFSKINPGPAVFTSQQALLYPSGNRYPPTYAPRPLTVDTSNQPVPAHEGGHIQSPRPSNKERQERNRWTSLFDVAGLATSEYHGGQ